MKIQTGIKLKNFDGVVMKDGRGKEMTSGKLMAEALLSTIPPTRGSQQPSGIEKYERANIAERLYNAKQELDVTAEEAVIIKNAVGEFYTPLGVKRLWDLIENEKPKKVDKKKDS